MLPPVRSRRRRGHIVTETSHDVGFLWWKVRPRPKPTFIYPPKPSLNMPLTCVNVEGMRLSALIPYNDHIPLSIQRYTP